MFNAGTEPITALSPYKMTEMINTKRTFPIPANVYGTVYLCPLPISLFKSLARALGKEITINDVLASSICCTVRSQSEAVGWDRNIPIRFVTPLVIPTKHVKSFLDESEGLASDFCPIMHELPRTGERTETRKRFCNCPDQTHTRFQVIKTSLVTSLMAFLMKINGKLIKSSDMIDEQKNSVGKATFVWSNVPGPLGPIYICGKKVEEVQCLVSNPFTMMQTLSYNGMVYTSIQVDTRTAIESPRLSEVRGLRRDYENCDCRASCGRGARKCSENCGAINVKSYPGAIFIPS